MTKRAHILLVDDEASLRDPLAKYLSNQGYRVTEAEDASKARTLLRGYAIDIVLLDIMMPGEDGLSFCRHVRETSDIPVIFLTAKAEETERIVGLEMGADDYVVKPFSPRELVARIKVALRRSGATGSAVRGDGEGDYAFAGWVLKTAEQALYDEDGTLVPISTGEFRMLHALVSHAGQVLSRDQLLDLTQGREAHAFDRAVDNQVSRLRKKIEPDPKHPSFIKTVWGGGYKLAVEARRL